LRRFGTRHRRSVPQNGQAQRFVVCGLCIFCAGKLMAATSSSFMVLVVARAISAVAAAAFSPAAYALASASV
jgi:predicted MFS family arabinose efflux permease